MVGRRRLRRFGRLFLPSSVVDTIPPTHFPMSSPLSIVSLLVFALSSLWLLFRIISSLQSGAMREEEHLAPGPLDIIRNSSNIGRQSFIQFSNRPDLFFYRSVGKSIIFFLFCFILDWLTIRFVIDFYDYRVVSSWLSTFLSARSRDWSEKKVLFIPLSYTKVSIEYQIRGDLRKVRLHEG